MLFNTHRLILADSINAIKGSTQSAELSNEKCVLFARTYIKKLADKYGASKKMYRQLWIQLIVNNEYI